MRDSADTGLRRGCGEQTALLGSALTGDGVPGEGLHADEVVVGAVLLQPLAHVLLTPQDHRPRQAAQWGARVAPAAVVRVQPALGGEGSRCSEVVGRAGAEWGRQLGTWGASVPGCCRSLTGRPPAALWLRESCQVRLEPGVRGRWQGRLSADTVCSRRVRQKLKWAVAVEQGTGQSGPGQGQRLLSLLSPSPLH